MYALLAILIIFSFHLISSTAFLNLPFQQRSIIGNRSTGTTVFYDKLNAWRRSVRIFSTGTTVDTGLRNSIEKLVSIGPIPLNDRKYSINGWRWHTMSVQYDLQRFLNVIQLTTKLIKDTNIVAKFQQLKRIQDCYNYLFQFSWKGLIQIERELFFPWLEEILPKDQITKRLMNDLQQEHQIIINLTRDLQKHILLLVQPNKSLIESSDEIYSQLLIIEGIVLKLQHSARMLQEVQEEVFVPFVGAYVPAATQEKFNTKVITNLGLINSQIHLVSMYEAIKNNPTEMVRFKQQIPAPARLLIPVWRKRFYSSRASCLDFSQ